MIFVMQVLLFIVVDETIGSVVGNNLVSSRYLKDMKEFYKGILCYLNEN